MVGNMATQIRGVEWKQPQLTGPWLSGTQNISRFVSIFGRGVASLIISCNFIENSFFTQKMGYLSVEKPEKY